MIPNPHPLQDNFGVVNGKNLSFSRQEGEAVAYTNRIKAITWYLWEVERRFKEAEFKNLELLGFYWMKEEIHSKQDVRLVKELGNMLHDKNYKWYWIPYYKAKGYDLDLGFDSVFSQPNYMFQNHISISRFWNTYVDAKTYGHNIELEGENSVLVSAEARERFLTYLKAGVTLGFWDTPKAYYFGTKSISQAARHDDQDVRCIYDSLYRFLSGKFNTPLF